MQVWEKLVERWYKALALVPQKSSSWYRHRLREELIERREAKTCHHKLSETSDVLFSITRARYDGFPVRSLPFPHSARWVAIYAYMVSKYSLRWTFYRTVAYMCDARRLELVCEVVNPARDQKLEEVARRHHIDPEKFRAVACQLRRAWPLLT